VENSSTTQLPLWSEPSAAPAWELRESTRARRLTVRVFHSGRVEVVVPARTSPAAVARFIERHRSWIERKRAEARGRARPAAPFPPALIELPACEQRWRVHIAGGGGRRRARVSAAGPGLLRLSGEVSDAAAVREALRRWLSEQAEVVLGPALERCAAELGLRYQRLLVRRQRTRWGSCSTRGTISLNCCLLFQRPPVVRYLMIHELAHTLQMNHSRRFWQIVATHCPDFRRLDRELLDGWRRVPEWVFGGDEPH
jgi:predicted metal-dependent hydrolase